MVLGATAARKMTVMIDVNGYGTIQRDEEWIAEATDIEGCGLDADEHNLWYMENSMIKCEELALFDFDVLRF
jgi:hypothetical protein